MLDTVTLPVDAMCMVSH
ncbi:hypothetical protein [Enterobacter kobei]